MADYFKRDLQNLESDSNVKSGEEPKPHKEREQSPQLEELPLLIR